MTEKRYKAVSANLECSNGMEYILIKRNDGFNVCQVCSKHTANEIVNELNNLHEENRRLKSQLCYNGSDVCDICKHQYLAKSENYYIAKCEKGHDECSKDYLKYCKDFDIKVKE